MSHRNYIREFNTHIDSIRDCLQEVLQEETNHRSITRENYTQASRAYRDASGLWRDFTRDFFENMLNVESSNYEEAWNRMQEELKSMHSEILKLRNKLYSPQINQAEIA